MPAAASIPPSPTSIPVSFGAQSTGNFAADDEYLYVKYNGWRRSPLLVASNFSFGFPNPSRNLDIFCDNQYFYLVVNHRWKRLPIMVIKPLRPILGDAPVLNIRDAKLTTFPASTDNYGRWGMISFNAEYFCIWAKGKWHKTPIARMSTRQIGRSVVQGERTAPPEFVPELMATLL